MAVAAVKASMARALVVKSAAVEAVVVVTRTAASGLATTMAVVVEVTAAKVDALSRARSNIEHQ